MGSIHKPQNQKHQNQASHSLLDQVVNPFLTIQKEVDKALHGFYDLFEHKPFSLGEIENLTLAPSLCLHS